MFNNKTVKNSRGHPKELEDIIIVKNCNFAGREFVFAAINNFLNQSDRGYFTIIGDPGIGKSAIVAHYVSQNPGIVYYNVEIAGKNCAEELLTTICTQLIEIAQHQGSKTCVERSRNNFTPNSLDFTGRDAYIPRILFGGYKRTG
jgi:hypothetical protein